MPQIKIFVDSDVVISSLLSQLGAAYYLINTAKNLELTISNYSEEELQIVRARLNINTSHLKQLTEERLAVIKVNESIQKIKTKFKEYTSDPNDTHIIAGAKYSKAKFLITYNLKHFKVDKIKKDLGIYVTTPANLLQYLRSIS